MLPRIENEHMWDLINHNHMDKEVYEAQERAYQWLYEDILELSPAKGRHRILGYPDGWEPVDITFRERKDDGTEEEWLLLLQLIDDQRATMSWGDGGCLTYWIRKDDLVQGKFDNIHRWWEQGC